MGSCTCQSDKSNAEEIQRKSSRARERMSESPLHAIRYENPSMPPIQARLAVGPAHDAFEQEADRIADEVMRMPAPVSAHTHAQDGTGSLEHGVQRDAAEGEELQRKPLAASLTPLLQRQPLQREGLEDEELQRDAMEEDELQRMGGEGGFEAGEEVSQQIQSARGGGQPLESNTRSFMESRFGSDFSGVRVHADTEAARMSRDLSAHAFTLGNDIFFGAGQYQPESDSGKHLLAHELTHVVQQGGSASIQRDKDDGANNGWACQSTCSARYASDKQIAQETGDNAALAQAQEAENRCLEDCKQKMDVIPKPPGPTGIWGAIKEAGSSFWKWLTGKK